MAHDDQGQHLLSALGKSSAVGDLAMEVVSVLSDRQSDQQHRMVRAFLVDMIQQRVTARTGFDAAELLAELRTYRTGDDAVIDNYIPIVSRNIGDSWVSSDMSFADVTIASVRLQSLLTEVAYGNPSTMSIGEETIHALVVICEGDQHTLGGFVAAAQLRRRGATVEVVCGLAEQEVANQITEGGYDAVLFSCSRMRSLETISRIVQTVRENHDVSPVFAMGGIILNICSDAKDRAGVDLAVNEVMTVLEYCAANDRPTLLQARK